MRKHILFLIMALVSAHTFGKHTLNQCLRINLPFIENKGQMESNITFFANTFAGTVSVSKNGDILYNILDREKKQSVTFSERFNHHSISSIEGQSKNQAPLNIMTAQEARSNLTTYNAVVFNTCFRDIEVKLCAKSNNIEKLFTVQPGGNPDDIRIQVVGAEALSLNRNGELVVSAENTHIAFTKPVAYQIKNNKKTFVDVSYRIDKLNYGFTLGQYDTDLPLIIDPLLSATFIGGSSSDDSYESNIAVDKEGHIFITGYTQSINLPVSDDGFDTDHNGGTTDRFICKFSNDLSTLLASTYIGGFSNDKGMAIVISENGDVYIAGYTSSSDFPVTEGAYDTSFNGRSDVYICCFDNNLTTLKASTFLGGKKEEMKYFPRIDMKIDDEGNVYVAGLTLSSDFPVTYDGYDTTYNGGSGAGDIFVSKMNADLSELLASTFLGSPADEWRPSIVLDTQSVFVCGNTQYGFPVAYGSYDITFNGYTDIFVTKLSKDLSTLIASTFIGGTLEEEALAMALSPDGEHSDSGDIYLAGYTKSKNFPVTYGTYDSQYNGGERDGFVAILDNNLTTLKKSTLVGGSERDDFRDIILDSNEYIYLTGNTTSSVFPEMAGAFDNSYNGGGDNGDGLIVKMDTSLTRIHSATYFGGSLDDIGFAIALDNNLNIIIGGNTLSSSLPATEDSYDPTFNGGYNYSAGGDCFLAKFDNSLLFVLSEPDLSDKVVGYLSHFDVTEGYWDTLLTLTNSSDSTEEVIIAAYSNDGNFINSNTVTIPSNGGFNRSIPELIPGLTISDGWLKIGSDTGMLSGIMTFTYLPTGSTSSLPITYSTGSHIVFPLIENSLNFDSGFAVVNPNPTETDVTVSAYDYNGTLLESVTDTLGANGKFATMAEDYFTENLPEKIFIDISSNQKITGFALSLGAGLNQIVSVPVSILAD